MVNRCKPYFLLLLSLVSCTERISTGPDEVRSIFLKASLPAGTKTVLDGLQCKWTPGDEIIVNGKKSVSIQLSADSLTARFEVSGVSSPYNCVSPSSVYDAGKLLVPSKQKFLENSYDPCAAILLAKTSEDDICFHHAMAYLALTVKAGLSSDAIKSVTISAGSKENMSGEFTIDGDYLSIVNDGRDGNGIVVDCGSGAPLGTLIVIAIPAKQYSGGLVICVKDVKNHYQIVSSKSSFTAVAGKLYPTSFTFKPTGTMIDGNLPDMSEYKDFITDFSELNASEDKIDSHSSDYDRSYISLDRSSIVELGPELGLAGPYYPRIRRMPDDSYLLMWHESDKDGDVNGMDVHYAVSPDLKNWENKGLLFARERNTYTPDGNSTRVYTNGNALVLPNGVICAVASFRPYSTYNKEGSQMYSGIELKQSYNCGRTWTSTGKVIHRGPNWEAHLLYLKNGRLQCYFSESHPLISSSNSGTAMVYSDDNGETWMPELGSSPWADYSPMHAIRHYWPSDSAYPERYTDQMPVLIQLHNSNQIVGVFETVGSYNSSTGSISWIVSQSRSPQNGEWPDLADGPYGTRGNGGEVYTSSAEYYNSKLASGGSPYLIQFPSGETVLAYKCATDGRQRAMIGDAYARNFLHDIDLHGESAGWGALELSGTHEIISVTRLHRGGDASETNPPVLGVARYFLNHSISPTGRTVTVDGRNKEWEKSDDALFVGAESDVSATLRSSKDVNNLYFLVEVKDKSLFDGDYACIYLSGNTSSLGSSALKIKVNKDGLVSSEKYQSQKWKADSGLGVTAASSSINGQGYVVEISIPRSSIPSGSTVLVDFAHFGQGLSEEERIADVEPATWLYLKNIN